MLIDRSKCPANRHGTYSSLRYGCTCYDSRVDRSRYMAEYIAFGPRRRIDGTGTARRLQALLVMGWSTSALGDRLGVTAECIRFWSAGDLKWVVKATHEKVSALYDELSMTPGPSKRARGRALAKGYVPPLAWDDDTIDDPDAAPDLGRRDDRELDRVRIERALAGDRSIRLTHAERRVCVERLWTAADSYIADLVGMSTRTVQRLRREIEQQQQQREDEAVAA